MINQPLLIMFLGYPGSGKSYFAKQLATKLHAVRLNGDAMRIALFKTVEAIEAYPDKNKLNQQTFDAIDYAVAQVLLAGKSVVYDAHHNKRSIRENLEQLADEYKAIPIVVWVKTPPEIAFTRGLNRPSAADSRHMTPEKMKESTERHVANFDAPDNGEKVIEIDGTVLFTEQYRIFQDSLLQILAANKN